MPLPAPKKSLGQNFLVDRNIAQKIVREFDPRPGEVVVEIGPGQGALTGLLVESDCTLVAVELDARMADLIEEKYAGRVEVIREDFLEFDLAALARRHGVERVRVIGNIPYYITSPIIFQVIDSREAVADAVLMMQKEVAQRLVAVPRTKDYGILAVMVQSYCRPKMLMTVGPGCFFPPPKVTSAVVRLEMAQMPELNGIEKKHQQIVRTAFNQRRKTLRNSLGQLIPNQQERDRLFEQAGIGPSQRAEELSREDFARLARLASQAPPGGDVPQAP